MTKIRKDQIAAAEAREGTRASAYEDLGGQSTVHADAQDQLTLNISDEEQDVREAEAADAILGVAEMAINNAGGSRGASDEVLGEIGISFDIPEAEPISPPEQLALNPNTQTVTVNDEEKNNRIPVCDDCRKPIPCGAHTVGGKNGKIRTVGY